MTDKAPKALDRMLDDLPVGHAPIEELLRAGHTAKRRHRTTVAGAATAAVLAVGLGTATGQPLISWNGSDGPVAGRPTTTQRYGVNVATTLDSDAVYFEGALTEVTITEAGSDEPLDPFGPGAPPWTRSWNDLAAGQYIVHAAVRACGGYCGYLDAPTDACERTITLDHDTSISINFRQGQRCTMTVSADERPEAGRANPSPADQVDGAGYAPFKIPEELTENHL